MSVQRALPWITMSRLNRQFHKLRSTDLIHCVRRQCLHIGKSKILNHVFNNKKQERKTLKIRLSENCVSFKKAVAATKITQKLLD